LARPPETVTVNDVLNIVSDSAAQELRNPGPATDILTRRDRAVHDALEGITLKSLAAENSQGSQSLSIQDQAFSHARPPRQP
jgi:DNA-binding IscR family transcriptional regulator